MDTVDKAMDSVESFLKSQDSDEVLWEYFKAHKQRYLDDLKLIMLNHSGNTILEVGSAPGHMTALIKCCGINITGVDLAPERVSEVVSEFEVDIKRCDVEREPLPFNDKTFDFIVFNEIFEHLRIDLPFVLTQLNRILKPGGTLMLTTPNLYSVPSIARFLTGRSIADPVTEFNKLRTLGHMGHVREYSAREVCDCLDVSGFEGQNVSYRFHKNQLGKKKALLTMMYRFVPSFFHREIVIMAKKTFDAEPLKPIMPMSD